MISNTVNKWKAVCCALFIWQSAQYVFAAEALRLRDGTSFVQDADNGFPIVADKFDDVTIDQGKPAILFFGASGDLNTNRQAKRFVDAYLKFHQRGLKFILIDLDHPAANGGALIKKYYRGYIPCEVLIDAKGATTWSQVGEVEPSVLKNKIEQAL